jgi:predicted ATPase
LDQISKNKKTVIWGFEEPENSLEYANAKKLAEDFLGYAKTKQIFITTHAKEFLSLQGGEVSIHRVFKSKKDGSSKVFLHQEFDSKKRGRLCRKTIETFSEDVSEEEKRTVLDAILKDLG